MSKDILGVEIFSVGTFTPGGSAKGSKVTIDDRDLDQMVESFNALVPIGGFTPVLKLGHTEAQRFMGQANGAPNLGIVQKIWRDGGKILADFVNVPDKVVELIERKRFNSVSVEIIPSFEFDGKKFANVLTAVALLGAELPAVKGLADLAATLFTEAEIKPVTADEIVSYEWESGDMNITQEQHEALVAAAVAKAIADTKQSWADDQERLTAERDAALDEVKTVRTEFTAFQDQVARKEAEALVDQAIEKGKLLPKQKDAALAFAMNLTGKVKFGDEEKSMAVLFAEFIDGMPPKVDMGEHGTGDAEEGDQGKVTASAGDKIHALVVKLREENDKLSYHDALHKVYEANPDLKAEYFNQV